MKSGDVVHRYRFKGRRWNEVGSLILINRPDSDRPTEQARQHVPGGPRAKLHILSACGALGRWHLSLDCVEAPVSPHPQEVCPTQPSRHPCWRRWRKKIMGGALSWPAGRLTHLFLNGTVEWGPKVQRPVKLAARVGRIRVAVTPRNIRGARGGPTHEMKRFARCVTVSCDPSSPSLSLPSDQGPATPDERRACSSLHALLVVDAH